MEKRVFLAMIITVMMFLIYASLNAPPPEEDPAAESEKTEQQGGESGAEKGAENGEAAGKAAGEADTATGRDPTGDAPAGDTEPAPGTSAVGVDAAAPFDGPLVLRTPVLRAELDQRGAVLRSLRLLDYDEVVDRRPEGEKTWKDRLEFIRTYEGGKAALGLEVDGVDGLDLDGTLWHTSGISDDGRSVVFTLDVTEGGDHYRLTKTIRLSEHRHRLDVEVSVTSLGEAETLSRTLWLRTSGGVFPVDRTDVEGVKAAQLGRSVVASRGEDDLETTALSAKELIKDADGPRMFPSARLAADMGVYFGAYLHLLDGGAPRGARISWDEPKPTNRAELERLGPPRTRSDLGIALTTTAEAPTAKATFDYYVGPKDHRAIRDSYPEGDPLRADYLEVADAELMSRGFCCIGSAGPIEGLIKAISKAVVWALTFFYGIFGSLGVSIMVLTICVRMIMFPVTRKSQVSMQAHSAKMAKIKPKLDKLKEKYKDDQKKLAEKQMKLMKEEKVGMVPLGGCLPMFLQIPVFFGLFSAIRFDVDLRHAGFLWCNDLSMPDRVLAWEPIAVPCFCPQPISIDGLNVFPLLMILAMVLHQMGMPSSPDPQMQQQQKMMKFMPVLFGVMLYSYPAGLAVYWLSSSLFGIFEQRVIRKFFPVPDAKAETAASGG